MANKEEKEDEEIGEIMDRRIEEILERKEEDRAVAATKQHEARAARDPGDSQRDVLSQAPQETDFHGDTGLFLPPKPPKAPAPEEEEEEEEFWW